MPRKLKASVAQLRGLEAHGVRSAGGDLADFVRACGVGAGVVQRSWEDVDARARHSFVNVNGLFSYSFRRALSG